MFCMCILRVWCDQAVLQVRVKGTVQSHFLLQHNVVHEPLQHCVYLWYRPIPDIVVAPVTRHFISLVGKNVKMATAMDGRRDLPAPKTETDSVESDSHSTSVLCEAISGPCEDSVDGTYVFSDVARPLVRSQA